VELWPSMRPSNSISFINENRIRAERLVCLLHKNTMISKWTLIYSGLKINYTLPTRGEEYVRITETRTTLKTGTLLMCRLLDSLSTGFPYITTGFHLLHTEQPFHSTHYSSSRPPLSSQLTSVDILSWWPLYIRQHQGIHTFHGNRWCSAKRNSEGEGLTDK
jgi:hypothetical protein